ncbi:MAG: hypothetical protein LBR29_07215 [Methylobacteriaceae bacterium]|jgi:hypothetical protein|nr:hypothetical protein [Methylobacteriaceae bacterium]
MDKDQIPPGYMPGGETGIIIPFPMDRAGRGVSQRVRQDSEMGQIIVFLGVHYEHDVDDPTNPVSFGRRGGSKKGSKKA